MLSGYRSQYLTGNGLYCDVPKTPLYKGREFFLGNFEKLRCKAPALYSGPANAFLISIFNYTLTISQGAITFRSG